MVNVIKFTISRICPCISSLFIFPAVQTSPGKKKAVTSAVPLILNIIEKAAREKVSQLRGNYPDDVNFFPRESIKII
jgi:hypothetical protein